MMEALMMLLSAERPVDAMADLLDEHDTRLWRGLMHHVGQAPAKSDWVLEGLLHHALSLDFGSPPWQDGLPLNLVEGQ
jgi:hypothetical protein